jgi:hypothetical protein
MKVTGYVACICEGAAEHAIMDRLLEEDLLKFDVETLIEGEILRCRNGQQFEQRYLRKEFAMDLTIVRILDSKKENFKLSKDYLHKVKVIDVVTAPEIEMLIIISEGKYKDFQKSKKAPSIFCKSDLKCKNVKSYQFVQAYFSDINKLMHSIKEYKRISKPVKGKYMLYDLLK